MEKPHALKQTRIKIEPARVLIAPATRPEDWREIDIEQLDKWAVRQWRDNALQPVAQSKIQRKEKT